MASNSGNKIATKEVDPWWAKYWYATAIALGIWMSVAIYGAMTYELELTDARVIVHQAVEDPRTLGKPICQIELWWVVIVVPLSLAIVNGLLAYCTRDQQNSSD